jgi:hypothetical protein
MTNAIGNLTSPLTSFSGVSAASAVDPTSATAGASGCDRDGDRDSSRVSGPAQLLSKLKQLQASDPAKFKDVMAKLSSTLKTDAKNASDPGAQKMLTDLASKFDTAAQSGDLSALTPAGAAQGGGHAHGHHHHHHSGGDSGSTTSDAATAATASATAPGASAYAQAAGGDRRETMKTTMAQLTSIVDAA